MCEKSVRDDKSEKERKFPLIKKKHYWNGLIRWFLSWGQIRLDGQDKQKLYKYMYERLKEKTECFEDDLFVRFLLLSFHETIMKMQKNKAKFLLGTVVCNIFEAVVTLAVTVILLGLYVQSIISDLKNDFSWDDLLFNDIAKSSLKYLAILLLILIVVFVIHKVIDLNMKYLKPKETWIRHSRHCYKMIMEISMYLDSKGAYNGGEEANYFVLRKRMMKIWEENQDYFQQNMKTEDKRESALDKVLRILKQDD